MWQRIQSVFLGVTIVSLLLALLQPISTTVVDSIEYRLFPIYFMTKQGGQITGSEYFPYSITSILIVAAITIAITEFRRYDNRMVQVRLGTLNSLILAGVLIFDVIFCNRLAKIYPAKWTYDLSLYLTFVAVACNWLAVRFIRRDEKLVKDSDRIR